VTGLPLVFKKQDTKKTEKGNKISKLMGTANQIVQTGTLSMPTQSIPCITLASPGRLYSARENLFEPLDSNLQFS
jgi:hypothetical protein